MRTLILSCLFCALALNLGACGDDSTSCDLLADGVCPPGCGADPDCTASDSGGDTGDDTSVPDNGVTGDEIYTDTCVAFPECMSVEVETACACVRRPLAGPDGMPNAFNINRVGCDQLEATGETVRNPDDDFCDDTADDGAAQNACNTMGSYRTRGEVQMVTMYGVVDVFGNGGDADMITVEIYEEGNDGNLGPLLGSATASTGDPCAESEDEIDNDMVVGTRQLGFYAIPNIPTETPLIVKTSGNLDFWREIYTYNIQAENIDLETDPAPAEACETIRTGADFVGVSRYEYRARILSSSDWTSIPLSAGLVDGVRSTSGVVAGEIHDCGDIRLEYAQVATNPVPEVLTYFNDNPDNPLPATGRIEGTSLLGLFAALDIPAGPVDIAAIGSIDDTTVSLGWYRARVFPGAVTSVTIRGLRPHQIPE